MPLWISSQSLEPTFGGINLEDIKAPECFEIERRLRERMSIPVFHDDQHGTAIIVGAAVMNAMRLVDKKLGCHQDRCLGRRCRRACLSESTRQYGRQEGEHRRHRYRRCRLCRPRGIDGTSGKHASRWKPKRARLARLSRARTSFSACPPRVYSPRNWQNAWRRIR